MSEKSKDKPTRVGDVVKDARFASIHVDPRFARAKKSGAKVKIDARFARVVADERFRDVTTSRRKRTLLDARQPAAEESIVDRLYEVEGNDDTTTTTRKSKRAEDGKEARDTAESASEDDSSSAADTGKRAGSRMGDKRETIEERLERLNAMARGEIEGAGSDDDASDSDDEAIDESREAQLLEQQLNRDSDLVIDPEAPDLEPDYQPDGSETRRLALVNCDWDNLRAVDIFASVASFAPASGAVVKVTVYPSDYGMKKMDEEARLGPVALVGKPQAGGAAASAAPKKADLERPRHASDKDEFDPVKLRAYELNKLKYYYAVIECDSVATAIAVYTQCDGMELEATSNVMDLRFVPDDTEFTNPPRDSAEEIPEDYEPPEFRTAALQSSRVELTWDAEDPQRKRALDWRRLTQIGDPEAAKAATKKARKGKKGAARADDADDDDADAQLKALQAYIASDSEEDGEDEDMPDDDAASSSDAGNGDAERRSVASRMSRQERSMADRARIRALLLGGDDADDGSEAERSEPLVDDSEEEQSKPAAGKKRRRAVEKEVAKPMEISFTPGLGKELQKRRKAKEQQANETVFEAFQRKRKEKRKEKKAAAKAAKETNDDSANDDDLADDSFFASGGDKPRGAAVGKDRKKAARAEDEDDEARQRAELELLMVGDDDAGVDSDEELAERRKRKKGRKAPKPDAAAQFEVDTRDARFAAAFSNPEFAIDKTAPQYKDTPAMRKLLADTTGAARPAAARQMVVVAAGTRPGGAEAAPKDVKALAAAVKAKFKPSKAAGRT